MLLNTDRNAILPTPSKDNVVACEHTVLDRWLPLVLDDFIRIHHLKRVTEFLTEDVFFGYLGASVRIIVKPFVFNNVSTKIVGAFTGVALFLRSFRVEFVAAWKSHCDFHVGA
jgi:hypothetical protein